MAHLGCRVRTQPDGQRRSQSIMRALRRNTDRKIVHRTAQLAFVIAILLVAKLLDAGHLTTA